MSTRIAVAIIHGMGNQSPEFAADFMRKLRQRFAREVADPAAESQLAFAPVHWAAVLQSMEDDLWKKTNADSLGWRSLRQFMVSFLADSIAYQRMPDDHEIYDAVHATLAEALHRIAGEPGVTPQTPLVVIAHSLGSIIASNYIYDLQRDVAAIASGQPARLVAPEVQGIIARRNTPLERGETFTAFFTLGSPIAIWSLRYRDYGRPISVPSPHLATHYPTDLYPRLSSSTQWINFHGEHDVIAWPLKGLSPAYNAAVTRDEQVNIGSPLRNWNPTSHGEYWLDADVLRPIASSLAGLWKAVNPGQAFGSSSPVSAADL